MRRFRREQTHWLYHTVVQQTTEARVRMLFVAGPHTLHYAKQHQRTSGRKRVNGERPSGRRRHKLVRLM